MSKPTVRDWPSRKAEVVDAVADLLIARLNTNEITIGECLGCLQEVQQGLIRALIEKFEGEPS